MFSEQLISSFGLKKTPFYYYDTGLLHKTLFAIKEVAVLFNYNIHYAVKANANERILQIISSYGLGADCVSGNEIDQVIKNGFNPKQIVFAGVGKTDEEITFAINSNIACFNCESIQELEVINDIAGSLSRKVNVALRINPNLDANTHHNITTGLNTNKFGIPYNDFLLIIEDFKKYENLNIEGLHFHIGSQITDYRVFNKLCKRVNEFNNFLLGKSVNIRHINLGGGLGIDYDEPENQIPDFQAYFEIFNKNLEVRTGQVIHFEPGRSIVGQSGILVTKVLYVKNNGDKKTIILDAGLTELLRPALYQSNHKIVNLTSSKELDVYDIAGPICETTDYFGRSVQLPETSRGDLLAIYSTGAYGEVMALHYNMRPPAEKYYSEELIL